MARYMYTYGLRILVCAIEAISVYVVRRYIGAPFLAQAAKLGWMLVGRLAD